MGKKNYLTPVIITLMAFLLILVPVSADPRVAGTLVGQGATVFVGEEGLDMSPIFETDTLTTYTYHFGWVNGSEVIDYVDSDRVVVAGAGYNITDTITTLNHTVVMFDYPSNLTSTISRTLTPSRSIITSQVLSNPHYITNVTVNSTRVDTYMQIAEPDVQVINVTSHNTTIGWWASGADITTSSPSKTIDVAARYHSMMITSSEFAGATGNWYLIVPGSARPLAFSVLDPTIDLTIRDANNGNSVNGKSVVRGVPLTFRIDTNIVLDSRRHNATGGALIPANDGYITIKVKPESGTTYTSLYDESRVAHSLTNLFINTQPYTWGYHWDTKTDSDDYPTGVYIVSAECNLNGMKDNYKQGGADYVGKTVTTAYTVTLVSDALKLESNKQSVVRGNSFSVTLTGKPYGNYIMRIKNIDDLDVAPIIIPNQEGVTFYTSTANVTVQADSSGQRTIEFSTNVNTEEHKYVIRGELIGDNSKYDEVSVSVAEGTLTLVAQGDQSYYLGEEIKFTGTNSETHTTYLFIIGPNLPSNGANLNDPSVDVVTGDEGTFVAVDVDGDGDTFTYDWSTARVDLDAGTYTIYAVSTDNSKDDLEDTAYATTSIIIKKPFVSAEVPKNTIAKGDKIVISGEAKGEPSSVQIWILGKNYVEIVRQSVEDDDTFKYEVPMGTTVDMASGQYFIVVQHPMQNGVFDIYRHGDDVVNRELGDDEGTIIFKIEGSGSLQGSDAAEALVEGINDPNIDDTYTKINFMLVEPVINIDPIPDKFIGEKFTLAGQTNLAVDDEILVEVYSSSFGPTVKTKSGEFSGTTGTVKVIKGENGLNTFSLPIDTSSFKADEYIVVANGIVQDATGTALFNVREGTPTPVPTPTPVATPTPVPTEVVTVPPTAPPTEVPTEVPTTKPSPGFGAIFALIGLAGVAFIVVRRE